MASTTADPAPGTSPGTSSDTKPSSTQGPRRRLTLGQRNFLIGTSFLLPNFLGFAIMTLVPVAALFYLSFTSWNAFGTAEWIGLENFTKLIDDSGFHTALFNTLYYSAAHIPLTFVVSLALAMLLNRKLRGVGLFRTAAFFPYITSVVAIAVVWNTLFSPEYGPINWALGLIGIDNGPGWTTSATWSMPAVIIVSVWRDMGYYMLLFLAGLQTVPAELYEAARVDGANAWRRFWNVTLPCLRPTTFLVTVLLTISSLKVFDIILVMTDGGPGTSTTVLAQYIYEEGFVENDFGYASAVSIVLFTICVTVTSALFALNKKRSL